MARGSGSKTFNRRPRPLHREARGPGSPYSSSTGDRQIVYGLGNEGVERRSLLQSTHQVGVGDVVLAEADGIGQSRFQHIVGRVEVEAIVGDDCATEGLLESAQQ